MWGLGAQPRSPPHVSPQHTCITNQLKNKIQFFFQKCSNLHERWGMCWNEWKINFLIFIFRVKIIFGHFCTPSFNEFFSRKKSEMDFSFDSAHFASFMKVGSKLRGGGGLRKLNWDRAWNWIGIVCVQSDRVSILEFVTHRSLRKLYGKKMNFFWSSLQK